MMSQNFVHAIDGTTKSIRDCILDEFEQQVDNSRMQYHNSVHTVVGRSRAKLFDC